MSEYVPDYQNTDQKFELSAQLLWTESELNCLLPVRSRSAQVSDNKRHSDVKEVAASSRQSGKNFLNCFGNRNSLFKVSYRFY
jgi:hypothetical protein